MSLEVMMAEATSPLEMCGEFTDEIRHKIRSNENVRLVSPSNSIRRPSILAELAWARWQDNDVDDEASLAPIYLHTTGPVPP